MERKRRFQTRQQYAEEKAKESKFDKVNNYLNYLIAVVAILIVVTLWMLIAGDNKSDKDVAQTTEQLESTDKTIDDATEDEQDEQSTETTEDEPSDDSELTNDSTNETTSENTVDTSTDPNVSEVQINPNWEAYPTQQTGEHVSTFKKGHIDYEEKLKAIFSVTDLQQENSIILSVRNNGSAQSAIGVVTSKNKEKKYRVSIEWVDGQGWKPVKLEVLNSLEGYE